MVGVQIPPAAHTNPEQHSAVDLQRGGFVQATHVPPNPVHWKPVQQSESIAHRSGLMQQAPAAHTWPAGQQVPLQQVSRPGPAVVQHVCPHAVVPLGHSHAHVVGLKTCLGPHGPTQMPVAGHWNVPAGHAQRAVLGSQKLLQHSSFCRQTVPPLRQRPGAIAPAPPAPTSDMTPPIAVAPKIFQNSMKT